MATPSCACGETLVPGPVCITVPEAGPAQGLPAAGPDHLQADAPSGTGDRGRALGTVLAPAFLRQSVAALAVCALLAQLIKMLINKRKTIEVIGMTAAAANISHGQRKQYWGVGRGQNRARARNPFQRLLERTFQCPFQCFHLSLAASDPECLPACCCRPYVPQFLFDV